ncbi:intracellular coagulation inhibitor 1-like [Ornithodoros turicata]|uniref:intracellular coagulation inhibitor 1-like n=1 Tax=Ornithodoros turicata TaxID=34597 RepID=UPI003139D7A7
MLRSAALVLTFVVGALSVPDDATIRFAEANNVLGLNLLKALPTDENHVFLSPFSISIAMSMVYHGARGVSEKELAAVLGYEAAGLHGRDEVLSAVQKSFQQQNRNVTLEVANAVLVNQSFPVLESYKKDLEHVFQAKFEEVNFLKESIAVAAKINAWVSAKTRGKIDKVVSELPPTTVLFIMNAVYFKGDWERKFIESQTTRLPFFNYGKSAKQVDTMLKTARYSYARNEDLKADVLELPYAGKEFSMLVFLPHERDGLRRLLEDLTPSGYQGAVGRLHTETVNLKLPKFKLESDYSLVEQLEALGAKSIFSGAANFTGIEEFGRLVVSDVIHKAVVEVNEKGSEAAAFTGIAFQVKVTSVRIRRPVEFNVDHPFLFFIRNKISKLILFVGAVHAL